MNLFDLNSNNITMNIEGKDIEMKPAICYGKEYDNWLVSRCGIVWSLHFNKILPGTIDYVYLKEGKKIIRIKMIISTHDLDFWGDGSGYIRGNCLQRNIRKHQIIMDTWAPLWDNPPKGVSWEQWVIIRELDTVYDYFTKSGSIDHIDNDPTNNHIDNLQRVNDWDNQRDRKLKGI